MREYHLNNNNNFIDGYYFSNLSICDELINLFEKSKDKTIGKTRDGIDKNNKDSLDLGIHINQINNNKILQEYFDEFVKCLNIYKNKYKFCNENVANWGIEQKFNIQKYKPDQAYHHWHSETSCIESGKRHLVFMTYLNDVNEGGTEFKYQKLITDAKCGLTVIWPTDFTHMHRGVISPDETKYIITGWYNYE